MRAAVFSARMQLSSYFRPCKVCLLEHDEEIHAATLNVHHWFHDQVTQGLWDDVAIDVAPPIEAPPPENAVGRTLTQ